jgi:hypothetical protein
MKKNFSHNVLFEKNNGLPYFEIGVNYVDDFFDDTYYLIGEAIEKYSKKINFKIYKNDNFLCEIKLNNYEFGNLMEQFLVKNDDFEFEEEFRKHMIEINENIINSVKKYKENSDKKVIEEAVSLSQKHRFKQLLEYSRNNH